MNRQSVLLVVVTIIFITILVTAFSYARLGIHASEEMPDRSYVGVSIEGKLLCKVTKYLEDTKDGKPRWRPTPAPDIRAGNAVPMIQIIPGEEVYCIPGLADNLKPKSAALPCELTLVKQVSLSPPYGFGSTDYGTCDNPISIPSFTRCMTTTYDLKDGHRGKYYNCYIYEKTQVAKIPTASPASSVVPTSTPTKSPDNNLIVEPFVFEFFADSDQSERASKDIESAIKRTVPFNRLTQDQLRFRIHRLDPQTLACKNNAVVSRGIECNRDAVFKAYYAQKPVYIRNRIIVVTSQVKGGSNEGVISYVSALEPNVGEIALHEIGHSAGLADLYPAGPGEQCSNNVYGASFTRFGNLIAFWPPVGKLSPPTQTKADIDSVRPQTDQATIGGFTDWYDIISWWDRITASTILVSQGKIGTSGSTSGAGLYRSDRCQNTELWMPYPESVPSKMRTLNASFTQVEEDVIWRMVRPWVWTNEGLKPKE